MYKLFKRTHFPGTLEVQISGGCDPGITRDHNEDAIYLQADDGRGYYLGIVCDGMGGHNAGEVASALAVTTLSAHIAKTFHGNQLKRDIIMEAFEEANKAIYSHAGSHPDAEGMGCTCVMVMGIGDRVYVAHCGDSRAYRMRGEEVKALTSDHTMVQEMVENGLITAEQAAIHPYRGRISRCLGHSKRQNKPDIGEFIMERADNILLCSDGLTDVLGDQDLLALVGQRDVRSASQRLIVAANKAGGPDNISAVIVRRIS